MLSVGLRNDVVAAAVLGAAGDVATQWIEGRSVDGRRLVAVTTFNALYIGGFLHYLYRGCVAVRRHASRL